MGTKILLGLFFVGTMFGAAHFNQPDPGPPIGYSAAESMRQGLQPATPTTYDPRWDSGDGTPRPSFWSTRAPIVIGPTPPMPVVSYAPVTPEKAPKAAKSTGGGKTAKAPKPSAGKAAKQTQPSTTTTVTQRTTTTAKGTVTHSTTTRTTHKG